MHVIWVKLRVGERITFRGGIKPFHYGDGDGSIYVYHTQFQALIEKDGSEVWYEFDSSEMNQIK